ncbi:hypothetical protein AVEN_206977-1 [Araneus ventricosus]|uniref:Uncharacterized protein n=1 Tax=Araneus ventricosus TaxID=182803 RepID=A0A4Y2LK34_ARAVE|nr:hypothetical protein AVEN_206977-1 [Araneus ventricosus]
MSKCRKSKQKSSLYTFHTACRNYLSSVYMSGRRVDEDGGKRGAHPVGAEPRRIGQKLRQHLWSIGQSAHSNYIHKSQEEAAHEERMKQLALCWHASG